MKVCVVNNASIEKFNKSIKPNLNNIDLVIFGYKTFTNINYEEEITGKQYKIKQLVNLSKELDCILMAGSNYNLFGKLYSSIMVCEKGVLLGIADSVFPLANKDKGKELKIFKTHLGKIGIIVNEDLFNSQVAKTQKNFEASFLINICDFSSTKQLDEVIRLTGEKLQLNVFSLNNKCFVTYNNKNNRMQHNFSDVFTKEYKI